MGKQKHDPALVLRVYRECGTQAETGRRLGIFQAVVGTILHRHGIARTGKIGRSPLVPISLKEAHQRHEAGENVKDIAASYGVSAPSLCKRLRRAGIRIGQNRHRQKERNFQWKGGKTKRSDKTRRQAHEVAASCLGTPLPRAWVVHHDDENPENNDPSNLILFETNALHLVYHQKLLGIQRRGLKVDTSHLASESGGLALPPPPVRPRFLPGRDRLAPCSRKEMLERIRKAFARST